MRECDVRECRAFGRSPKEALRSSLRCSVHAVTALDGAGKVLAMMGVSPGGVLNGKGIPWFLGSDDVFLYARDLIERGPAMLGWFHQTFPVMENVVSVENAKAIRLLRAWGARIGTDVRVIGGLEFVPFVLRAAIQADGAPE